MLSYLALAALVAPAFAQLSTFRGTIPGSLHQCEATNMFFFDSGSTRPLSVLFLPQASVPASLLTGTTTLSEALQYSPLLALSGITTADANEYDFSLQVAAGTAFEVFGFLPDGTGKNLNLPRTVTTALPGATNCLVAIPTTVPGFTAAGGAAAATPTTTSSTSIATSTRATTTSARTMSTITSIPLSTSTGGSTTGASSAAAAASSTKPSSASGVKAGMVLGFAAVLGAALVLVV